LAAYPVDIIIVYLYIHSISINKIRKYTGRMLGLGNNIGVEILDLYYIHLKIDYSMYKN
jgi:hypothetical protein